MIDYTEKFQKITGLNKYKFKAASAGTINSLFLAEDGKVFACGDNRYGQISG